MPSPHPHPPALQTAFERLRRQVYLLVSVLGLLSQLIIVAAQFRHAPAVGWEPGFGVLVCAVLLTRRVPLARIDQGLLVIVTVGVGVQLVQSFALPAVSVARLYIIGIILVVTGFSVLRTRPAVLYAAGVFVLFLGLTWQRHTPEDSALLAEMGITLVLVGLLSVFGQRVSAERAEALLYQHLAHTDPLTGLDNRRAMYAHLDAAYAEHQTSGTPFSVLLLDLDYFKQVNDAYGHSAGDDALVQVARLLERHLHSAGRAARWGGEEFLVLLPGLPLQDAAQQALHLCRAVRHARWPNLPPLTVSIGVMQGGPGSQPALLQRVDTLLYRAKTAGRDRVVAGLDAGAAVQHPPDEDACRELTWDDADEPG